MSEVLSPRQITRSVSIILMMLTFIDVAITLVVKVHLSFGAITLIYSPSIASSTSVKTPDRPPRQDPDHQRHARQQ